MLVETTVDEEFGGANGTLACRLRGYTADGAVLAEPTGLAVCHATRGGIQYRLHARGSKGGMDFGGGATTVSALHAMARAAVALADAERGRGAPIYQYLLRSGEELPWGTEEGTPTTGALEFWAEILPGVSREELEAELRGAVAGCGGGTACRLSGSSGRGFCRRMSAIRRQRSWWRCAPRWARRSGAADGAVRLRRVHVRVQVDGGARRRVRAGRREPARARRVRGAWRICTRSARAYVRLALDWCGAA